MRYIDGTLRNPDKPPSNKTNKQSSNNPKQAVTKQRKEAANKQPKQAAIKQTAINKPIKQVNEQTIRTLQTNRMSS